MEEQYQLGSLTQAVNTIQTDVAELKTDLKEMRVEMGNLNMWKAKVVGFASAVGAIISAGVSFIISKI